MNIRMDRMWMWACISAAVWLGGPADARETASGVDHIRRHSVTWNTPSVQKYDAMPLGNGSMGMLVSATADGKLHLIVSHVDAWSEAHRLLKLGIVTVTITPNPFDGAFQQRLHLDKGLMTLKGSGGFRAELRVDARTPVFYLDASCEREFAIEVDLETWRTEEKPGTRKVRESNIGDMPNGLLESGDVVLPDNPGAIAWYHRNQPTHHFRETLKLHQVEHLLAGTPDILANRTFGGWISGTGFKSISPQTVKSAPAMRQHLRLHTLNKQTATAADWIDEIRRAARTKGEAGARAGHLQWWRDFWQRSWIDVSGNDQAETVARGYAHIMYMNALAGRGELALPWNGSIFAPDPRIFSTTYHGGKAGPNPDPDWRMWDNLMLNQNIRLPYYSMLAAGQADFARPYIDMYMRGLPLMRAHTQAVFGHDGTFFREGMTHWGISAPGMYGFNRDGLKPGQQRNVWHRTHWQGGLETAYFMADYYDHTQDDTFAGNQLVPLAGQVVRFFDLHWPHKDGKLFFPNTYAMETFRDTDNPMPLVAGMHAVVERLLALPERLTSAGDRAYWRELQKRLPDIPTRKYQGKTILANAAVVRDQKVNVEVSELYAVFPYHLYGVGLADLKMAQDTWRHRTIVVDDVGGPNPNWSPGRLRGGWRQESVMAAMVGLTDVAQMEVTWAMGRVEPGMRYPGFFATTYDWVPDAQHAGMAATTLQRMLLQEVDGKIILLPAWPEDWSADFKLHAKRQTVVEGFVKDGRIVKLTVTPEQRRKDTIGEY